ncbi:AsmA family protein [Methylophaga sp. OBS4]|uniref:AsmA family protein n=1 Tax=Methylophaga sp. OBS4 TaxID=2991935 RepID=UPI0022556E1D|nr:AsmA family protein [Methylophaga sp. OBS4]MCX4186232.1 AsmA family protein [Methylophaga sp. OBS4]
MTKPIKIMLFSISGFLGLLIICTLLLISIVDINSYKSELETTASRALGMGVSINGGVEIGLFQGLLITLADVHIRNNEDRDIASVSKIKLGIDLLPLLKKEIRIVSITLKQPSISLETDSEGNFNFRRQQTAAARLPVLNLKDISFSDGTFYYANKQSGDKFEASECSMDMSQLQFAGGQWADLMKNLYLTAELDCEVARRNDFAMSDFKLKADGNNGMFDVEPITMQLFGAQGTGSIQANFSDAVPRYEVSFSLPKFRIEEFFKTLSPNKKKVAEGEVDFSANLSMQGKAVDQMKQTMGGQFSLRGDNLTLFGKDIDQSLSQFEASQSFNLVDMGAFFFAGPLGTVVTKGYRFASIFQGDGGRSDIRTLISDWKMEHGVAQAQDVALATNENRIALRGGLDFINQQYDDMTVAVIDEKGCAKAQQKIRGSFQQPVVEKPSILESLSAPLIDLLERGRDLFSDGECEVFYAGSITVPK